jgi:hypothetical protein
MATERAKGRRDSKVYREGTQVCVRCRKDRRVVVVIHEPPEDEDVVDISEPDAADESR